MITVVSAGTPDYAEMMAENRGRCEALGYRYVAHDLEMGPDLAGVLPPCTFKPTLIAKVLADSQSASTDGGHIIAYLDADAIVVRPLDDLEHIEFDVAVTLREPDLVGATSPITNYLNAGVCFFRNTEAARKFLGAWEIVARCVHNDQAALNELVGMKWTDEDWRKSYDTTIGRQGILMHILPCTGWNHHEWSRPPAPDCRIFHFKHGWRTAKGANWWREVLKSHDARSAHA